MGCLDDLEVLELVSGSLPAADLRRADAHLDSCEDCRELVASVTRARRLPAEAPELEPGQRVGRFVLQERKAAGAMGVVYTALDPELGRRVAIKVLRPELVDGEARARLIREAQAMARVADPNVVAVYEVGTVGEQVFVAMELVEGSTLREWLAATERSSEEILDAFTQAGHGLAAAHRAALVHRDFKPDNVLVGDDDRVRVTDFGLASAPSSHAGESELAALDDLVRTRTGALMGTPAYMSPEQLAGAGADARSDQFAFAVALFEALYGARPFPGSSVRALADAIRARQIQTPRDRRINAKAYAALLKALEPAPENRHVDMRALLQALAAESSSLVGLGAALAVAVIATIGFAMWWREPAESPACRKLARSLDTTWNEAGRAEIEAAFTTAAPSFGPSAAREVSASLDQWTAGFQRARADVCASDAEAAGDLALAAQVRCLDISLVEVRTLIAGLAEVDREGVARAAELTSGSLPDVALCADRSLQQAGAAPSGESRQESFLAREGMARARARLVVGDLTKAKADAAQAVDSARRSNHLPTIGAALLLSAEVARAQGAADEALDLARQALFALEEGKDDRGSARAWILMITIEGGRARYDRANEWAGFANAALARAGKPMSLEADLNEAVGAVQLARGEIDAAETALQQALALTRELGEADGARGARVLTNLGNLRRARGDMPGALEHHRAALELDERRLGKEHPQNGRHWHNIAGVLKAQRQLEDAEIAYQRALAIKLAGLGKDHPEVGLTLNSLGIVAQERGEMEKARRLYQEAIRIFALHHHEQEAVLRKNLETLAPPSPAAPAQPSAGAPKPNPPKLATPNPTAPLPSPSPSNQRLPGKEPSYMPAPAWP